MCGEAACALRWSRLAHFSTTTKVSSPNLAPGPPSASITGPYSIQPSSAWTAGMLARNRASTSSRLPGLVVMMASTWIIGFPPGFGDADTIGRDQYLTRSNRHPRFGGGDDREG